MPAIGRDALRTHELHPPDIRNSQSRALHGCAWNSVDDAVDEAEPFVLTKLGTVTQHYLHADTDTQERSACPAECLDRPIQTTPTELSDCPPECTYARQDETIRPGDLVRSPLRMASPPAWWIAWQTEKTLPMP